MKKSDLQRLIKLEDRIKVIATDMGLEYVDVEFDVCSPQKMLEIMSYRLPTNISSWKYGRDYEKARTIYESIDAGLPYEVVIHSDPARAYLMNNNTLSIQCLVIAHVYGHVNFFTENKYFRNSRSDIMGFMAEATKRFNSYEKRYGIEEVERIVDAGHAIQLHSSPFHTETEEEKRERVYKQSKKILHRKESDSEYGDFSSSKTTITESDVELMNQRLWRKLKTTTPVEPTEDLLRYIIDNSSALEDWQKDILETLRIEGQYFWPIMKTKHMNEGWACVVGDSLVHTENGFVPIVQAEEFCDKVVGINNNLTEIGERFITKNTDTIKIQTNTGLELEGAEYHRVLKKSGDDKEDIFLKDISIGDEVYMSVGCDIWPGDKVSINIDSCLQRQMFSKSQYVNIPTIIDEDIAYFMGSIIAEGHIFNRGISFTNQNTKYLKKIQDIVKNVFDKDVMIKDKSDNKGTKTIFIYSTTILDFMEQSGMKSVKSDEKEVPWSILQSPKNIVSQFIAGLFDGDGCVYHNGKNARNLIFTSKSEKLIRQLSIILLNYGIIGSFRLSKKEGYDDCYQLVISKGKCLEIFNDNIPICDEKKISLLNECIESIKWCMPVNDTCKVISITKGSSVCYDWNIPDGNYYVAQGIINHNTMVHEKIMTQLFQEELLDSQEHAQFNYSNSLVKAKQRMGLNPYLVGSAMWRDIEDRWNKGRHGREWNDCTDHHEKEAWNINEGKGWEKCLEVMKSYTDWFFMQDFLTVDLIDELDLYLYQPFETPISIEYIRTDHTADQVRQIIINSFAHSGIPKVEVVDGNMRNAGMLHLKHSWGGSNLDKKYALNTIAHIRTLWGRLVLLETMIDEKKIVYLARNEDDGMTPEEMERIAKNIVK